MSRSPGIWSLILLLNLIWYIPGLGQAPGDVLVDSATVRVRIPGSRLSLIPPNQFFLSHDFSGLIKSDGKAVIQVYDFNEGNFYNDARSFTKVQFEGKGARVLALKSMTVSGFPARYCYMEGDSAKRIMALVFGDSSFSTTLIGLYPDTDKVSGELIRDAFASISYSKAQVVSPFETAPFFLDTAASGLRFAQYNEPLFIYTRDGKEPGEGAPFLTVTAYPRKPKVSLQELSESLLVKDMQHGVSDPDLRNMSLDSVGGYEAYEVEVYCKLGGQNGVIYQFIASAKDKTIVIEGIANNAFAENVKSFRALAHTIRIH